MPEPAAQSENSASYLQSMIDAVRQVGAFERVEAKLQGEPLEAFRSPRKKSWWPGSVLSAIILALHDVTDGSTVQQVAYLSTKNGVAPVAMPLVKVTFALFGPSPHTIFAKASQYATTSVRGLELEWKKDGDRSGVLWASYPNPVPAQYADVWKGTLQFVFELTKVAGAFGAIRHERDGRALQMPVSWS